MAQTARGTNPSTLIKPGSGCAAHLCSLPLSQTSSNLARTRSAYETWAKRKSGLFFRGASAAVGSLTMKVGSGGGFWTRLGVRESCPRTLHYRSPTSPKS